MQTACDSRLCWLSEPRRFCAPCVREAGGLHLANCHTAACGSVICDDSSFAVERWIAFAGYRTWRSWAPDNALWRTRLCVETVFLCIEHVCSAEKDSVAFASTIHKSTYTWPRVLGESLRDVDVQKI